MNSNLHEESDFTYEQFSPAAAESALPVVLPSGTIFVSSVNGITGSITISPGTTGLTFTPAGATISLGGTLAVANGGTGATTAAAARTALGAAQSGTNGDITSLTALQEIRFPATTPAQIVANTNDYNPGAGAFFRITTDASRNITGIAAGGNGDLILLRNAGAFDFVLTNQDVASAAANRIITGTGASVTYAPDETAMLIYDATTARWVLIV